MIKKKKYRVFLYSVWPWDFMDLRIGVRCETTLQLNKINSRQFLILSLI